MTNERLGTLLHGLSREVRGEPGYWTLEAGERQVLVITDEGADRMRIMTPVAEEGSVPAEELPVLLGANFDRALDARYAAGRGYLWSVFVHPLSTLTDSEFLDGVEQVMTLARNYGTTYARSDLAFQGGQN
jgi:hypothetical protein